MSKRLFDIGCALFGLVVLSPVMMLAGVMVVLDSKGGIFYRQIRVGKGGKDFYLYKFRTMKPGSDAQGLITIGAADTRITRTGKFLRQYKIDEIPQLFNVLKGEMSMVGPRPEVRKYVNYYTPEQRHVLDIKPGITEMASILFYNENELLGKAENPEETYIREIMPKKLALNLEYLKKRSLVIDLKIIWGTLVRILQAKTIATH